MVSAKDECERIFPMPRGYEMREEGGGLVVCGPQLSFFVTPQSIESGRFRSEFGPNMEGLLRLESEAW